MVRNTRGNLEGDLREEWLFIFPVQKVGGPLSVLCVSSLHGPWLSFHKPWSFISGKG